MKAATHNGTCQVCGHKQALPGGVLAKHGYTVVHNFFEGVCPGAHHKPLEQERSLADEVAASLVSQSKELSALAVEIRAGRALPTHVDAGFSCPGRYGSRVEVELPFADGNALQQSRAVHEFLWDTRSRSKDAASIAASISKRADEIHGKRPLTARTNERSAPLVHVIGGYWSKRLNRSVKACASSWSSTEQYAVVTDDASKVTCKSCLKRLAK